MQWSKRKLRILIAVLTVVLLMLSGTAGVMAKYATQETVGGQLTIMADLGEITLNATAQEYTLLPGVDESHNATVSLSNMSAIPAYVFLVFEMSENYSDTRVDLELDENWLKVSKSEAKAVYVYAPGGTAKKVTASDSISKIDFTYTMIASQFLLSSNNSVKLTITACMGQATAGDTVETVYGRISTQ